MKMKTLAIAALLSLVVPAAAFGQASTTTSPAPAAPTASTPASDIASFDILLDELGKADFTSATAGLSVAPSFKVVKLSSLEDADATRLKDAIDAHKQDIADLGDKVWANAKAKAALEAQSMTAEDVVWIDSAADGIVTIYVNDLETM
jgi:hypothetical protein